MAVIGLLSTSLKPKTPIRPKTEHKPVPGGRPTQEIARASEKTANLRPAGTGIQ